MSYNAIFEQIFSMLVNDATLVPGILGPRTATNLRLYRAWPQLQSLLLSYEPQPPEGWLVVEQPQPSLRLGQGQLDSNHELFEIAFHCYATQYSVAQDVLDVLDTLFHWSVQQQRDLTFGERIVLFTRRYSTQDKYAQDVKLFEKVMTYFLETVRDVEYA
jgi:hypothetical protein